MLEQVIAECSTPLKQKRKCNHDHVDEKDDQKDKVIRKELIMNPEADKGVAQGYVKLGVITWKTVTTVSFNDLFQYDFDQVHYENGRTAENVLLERWFRLFYTDPSAFWSKLHYNEAMALRNSSALIQSAMVVIQQFNATESQSGALLPQTLFQAESHLSSLEMLCYEQAMQHYYHTEIRSGLEQLMEQTIQVQRHTATFIFETIDTLSDIQTMMGSLHTYLALVYTAGNESLALITIKAKRALGEVDKFDAKRLHLLALEAQGLREEFQRLSLRCGFHLKYPIQQEILSLQKQQDKVNQRKAKEIKTARTKTHEVAQQVEAKER